MVGIYRRARCFALALAMSLVAAPASFAAAPVNRCLAVASLPAGVHRVALNGVALAATDVRLSFIGHGRAA